MWRAFCVCVNCAVRCWISAREMLTSVSVTQPISFNVRIFLVELTLTLNQHFLFSSRCFQILLDSVVIFEVPYFRLRWLKILWNSFKHPQEIKMAFRAISIEVNFLIELCRTLLKSWLFNFERISLWIIKGILWGASDLYSVSNANSFMIWKLFWQGDRKESLEYFDGDASTRMFHKILCWFFVLSWIEATIGETSERNSKDGFSVQYHPTVSRFRNSTSLYL